MKKMLQAVCLIVAFYLTSLPLLAQQVLNEATLTYRVSIESTSKEADLQPMGDASFTVYIKGNQSRTDMKSTLGTETTLFDHKAGKGVILKEYSGQKLMITVNQENWNQRNRSFRELPITLEKTTQTISGFNCQDATAMKSDGKKIAICYLPDRKLVNSKHQFAFGQLPGIAVQYSWGTDKFVYSYTLTNLSTDPVPAAKFDVPTSGYRVMTYEESLRIKRNP